MTKPSALARSAGFFFLLTILGGVFAEGFVSDRLIDFHDAAATAANILAHKGLFQIGFTVYLIEMASQIATAAFFYRLLKPVDRTIALLALVFELSGCVIKIFARVLYIAPLWVLENGPVLKGFDADQVHALALLLLRVNERGAGVALAFFGFSTPLNGYLVLRSTFLPRWLGALSLVAGVGWLAFLYPPLGYRTFMFMALLGLVSSAAMIFWLLVFGVNETRWRERAVAASMPPAG